jgi:hypothetical protein
MLNIITGFGIMELTERFECWREIKGPQKSWGLSWFIAAEFCKRFYSSHGLVPWVIDHEGLGYYGIEVSYVRCSVHSKEMQSLGRFTMSGDVENWTRGGPGDHGLQLIDKCVKGVATRELIRSAIAHFELDPLPRKSHVTCRHKRWGDSYSLCFEVSAYLALRYEVDELAIWNHPEHIEQKLQVLDSKAAMKEHPGAFLFIRNGRELLIAGDGRILDETGGNVWDEYMKGESVSTLAELVVGRLDA